MKSHFIDDELTYTGAELANHWIYKNCGIMGDAVVAFQGPCEVDKYSMVDLEDVLNEDLIYSSNMLNFILEIFGIGLREGVILQRLFTAVIQSKLQDILSQSDAPKPLRRIGDDLFFNDVKKLSVSIRTVSPTSILIHTGLNIESEGTPVESAGLVSDLGMSAGAIKPFALSCMKTLAEEWNDIQLCCCKVRAVV